MSCNKPQHASQARNTQHRHATRSTGTQHGTGTQHASGARMTETSNDRQRESQEMVHLHCSLRACPASESNKLNSSISGTSGEFSNLRLFASRNHSLPLTSSFAVNDSSDSAGCSGLSSDTALACKTIFSNRTSNCTTAFGDGLHG